MTNDIKFLIIEMIITGRKRSVNYNFSSAYLQTSISHYDSYM